MSYAALRTAYRVTSAPGETFHCCLVAGVIPHSFRSAPERYRKAAAPGYALPVDQAFAPLPAPDPDRKDRPRYHRTPLPAGRAPPPPSGTCLDATATSGH